jgi:transcriptional regulator with XRE-family HTH domain
MLDKEALKAAFSKRLYDLMDEKKISQKELAKGVDTSQQAIQQYIAMETSPKMDMFVAIADYLGVSCDYLLGRVNTRTPDVNMQGVIKKYGLNETSLNELERLNAPEGKVECLPFFINKGEEPLTIAELDYMHSHSPTSALAAKMDARSLREKKMAKDAIDTLNNILSWKGVGRLLSRLNEFFFYGRTLIDDRAPIQLTQRGHTLDHGLSPVAIHGVLMSMITDMLYSLRYELWKKRFGKKGRDARYSLATSKFDDTDTETKITKKTTTKKKGAKNGIR